MIKQISAHELKPGMYIHDLNCGWMDHPFMRKQFPIDDEGMVRKIVEAGIHKVYIDTARGLDVAHAPTEAEVREETDRAMLAAVAEQTAPELRRSVAEEMAHAKKVHDRAAQVVREVMRDVRLGRAVQVENVEAVVQEITESVLSNAGALLGLIRIKNKDDYTFLHCVSVGTLMVTFAHSLNLDAESMRQAGIGGLLHDVGKMKTPDSILNKPGKLTDEEFAIVKRHPEEGHAMLLATPSIGPVPLDITRHHHERMDGSGYPDKLAGDAISRMAQMAAIVDVYDAITSDRVYHKGMQPTEALRKLFEWSKAHFNPGLVQAFMRCTGIYPVGTLVRLESGRLAVVMEKNDADMLSPKVKAVFSTKSECHIQPEVLDLARGADRIVGHESPHKWGLDPLRYL